MSNKTFDSNDYWRKRHDKFLDNSQGVGNLSFSQEENDEIYERSRQRLGKVLDTIKTPKNVLDLGCGIGLMVEPFVSRNIAYTGVDISESAIASASRKFSDSRFVYSDISQLDLEEKFDLVMERTVFIHLVDETKWLEAIDSVKRHLADDGVFMIQDDLPVETQMPAAHVIFRSYGKYAAAFNDHGLEFDETLTTRVREVIPAHNLQFVRCKR